MKHLLLILLGFGLIGCATNYQVSSSRADEIRKEVRAERLAAEQRERQEQQEAMKRRTADRDINDLIAESMATQKALDEEKARVKREEALEKELLISRLQKRCESYGFTGESNIAACIQREAQHDKELAIQKYELQKTRLALQQAQSNSYAQSYIEPVEEDEDLPFLIKFLGEVAMGVAENLADPAVQQNIQQQQQINQLKANQNRDIYRNCKPNC